VTNAYRGSCLCGAVAFEATDFDERVGHCHCSMCRKFHGAEYATFASVPRTSFHWLHGQDAVTEFKAANGTVRSFCRHCGSSLLFWSPRAPPDIIEVALGVFDGDVPVTPDAHIFVGAAANWTSIEGDLPQFLEGRGSIKVGK
jgi:hypothetical protein